MNLRAFADGALGLLLCAITVFVICKEWGFDTVTTLLIGSFAGISAARVGLVWNDVYSVICGFTLSLWVAVYAFLL